MIDRRQPREFPPLQNSPPLPSPSPSLSLSLSLSASLPALPSLSFSLSTAPSLYITSLPLSFTLLFSPLPLSLSCFLSFFLSFPSPRGEMSPSQSLSLAFVPLLRSHASESAQRADGFRFHPSSSRTHPALSLPFPQVKKSLLPLFVTSFPAHCHVTLPFPFLGLPFLSPSHSMSLRAKPSFPFALLCVSLGSRATCTLQLGSKFV
jgi:hypothetical protein